MRHPIDPLVDYCFKRLFGVEQNKNLLLHFLNAVLKPSPPIRALTLLNPFLERGTATSKLSVVDVLAEDTAGAKYQVEVQLAPHAGLPERMVYTWAKLHESQLESGEDYGLVRPTISIWLLRGVLLPGHPRAHHCFEAIDAVDGARLSEHMAVHLLELPKWRRGVEALDAADEWVYFLSEARRWTSLPAELSTPEMRQAMGTLREISEKERAYYAYLSRLDAERRDLTIANSLKRAEARLEQVDEELKRAEARLEQVDEEIGQAKGEAAQAQEEAAQAQEEAAQAQEEAAALRAQLLAAGLTPKT